MLPLLGYTQVRVFTVSFSSCVASTTQVTQVSGLTH
jgi:hypothetical protein